MTIIIDTREQKRLEFNCPTIIEKLEVGDYGCKFDDGTISNIIFERKGIADIYGTLSAGYDRFKREILKASENKITLIIIIEGSLRRVLSGYINSKRTPISIVYQLFTLRVRYGIEAVFCNNREEMSSYITHMFLALEREYEDSKKRELLS